MIIIADRLIDDDLELILSPLYRDSVGGEGMRGNNEIRKEGIMPKNTGIIADYEANPDENDCLRWLIDTHSYQHSFYKENHPGKAEQYEHVMYILKIGLKRLFRVEIDYSGDIPKYYRVSKEYIK